MSVLRRAGNWCHTHVIAKWRSHLTTLAVFVVAVAAVELWRTRDVPAGLAPEFVLQAVTGPAAPQAIQAMAGQTVSLAQWRAGHPGGPVAVHIWAEWCPYCKLEEAAVTRVSADWPVLTVAYRSGDGPQVARVMAQRQLPWVAAVDPGGTVMTAYGLSVVPAWIVLDASGHISSVATGYTTEWGMRARLWWAQWR